MLPVIKIDHDSRGLKGLIHTLLDWWNIFLTAKYKNLNSGAKMFYIMSHRLLEKKNDKTFHLWVKYVQLTKILKMNDAIKYD